MAILGDIGRSGAGQSLFSDLMKYRQQENQDALGAMQVQNQQQMADIHKAAENRAQTEFQNKQQEYNTVVPLSMFLGPQEKWTESQKYIVSEGEKAGYLEKGRPVPSIRMGRGKEFLTYLKTEPEVALKAGAMRLAELDTEIGELRQKLITNPGDVKAKEQLDSKTKEYSALDANHTSLATNMEAGKIAVERAKKETPKVSALFHNENGDIVRQLDTGQLINSIGDEYEGDPSGLIKVGGENKPKVERWSEPYDMKVDGKVVRVQKEETTGQVRTVAQGQNISINAPTPEETTAIVEMIHDNGLDPSQIPKRGGVWNKAMAEWKKTYPDENINDYAAFAKWKRDISVNKSMALLDSIEPMLVKMKELHDKLGLSRFTDINRMNVWLKQHTGDPDVAKYETYMRNVVQELPPAMTTYFPTDTRIMMELKNLETPKAPAQIGASIDAVRDLVQVRRQQFNSPSWSPLMKNQSRPSVKRLIYNSSTGQLE